ncbi:hypothetical protein N7540_011998 [Penicillium herquei]|nr:hypothetical protein N7540_011998 [Penicillium herquei]
MPLRMVIGAIDNNKKGIVDAPRGRETSNAVDPSFMIHGEDGLDGIHFPLAHNRLCSKLTV